MACSKALFRHRVVEELLGIALEMRRQGKGRHHVIGDHLCVALGPQAIDLAVEQHHFAVEIIECADSEVALLADEADRRIGAVNSLDQRSQRCRDEDGRTGFSCCRNFLHDAASLLWLIRRGKSDLSRQSQVKSACRGKSLSLRSRRAAVHQSSIRTSTSAERPARPAARDAETPGHAA